MTTAMIRAATDAQRRIGRMRDPAARVYAHAVVTLLGERAKLVAGGRLTPEAAAKAERAVAEAFGLRGGFRPKTRRRPSTPAGGD